MHCSASTSVSFRIGVNQKTTQCAPVVHALFKRKRRNLQTISTSNNSTVTIRAYNRELSPNMYYRYFIISTTPFNGSFMQEAGEISSIWKTSTMYRMELFPYLISLFIQILPYPLLLILVGLRQQFSDPFLF